MDLRQGKITLGEILRHPQARELLTRELPQFARSPLLGLAGGMTLNQILIHGTAGGVSRREKGLLPAGLSRRNERSISLASLASPSVSRWILSGIELFYW